jgi:single-strand DNA-binding protein
MYLNRLTIRGFLGNDAETRSTASGKTYISLSIATKTSWKDDKNEWQSLTEWHRAVVWGESLAKYAATLKTGDFVQVEGRLRSREYEDKTA